MHKIFISYSRADYHTVLKLKDEIEHVIGKDTCWIDLTGIESDRQFVDVIIDAIDKADIFLFMYSKHSDRSEWTRKEIEYAYSEKKKIVFVRIDKAQLSKYFRFQFGGHDIIDINDILQKRKLIENLYSWCGGENTTKFQKAEERPNDSIMPFSFTRIKANISELLLILSRMKKQKEPVSFLLKKIKNDKFKLLLILLLILSFTNIVSAIIVFIGINYLLRDQLQTKHPKYWQCILKVKSYSAKILFGLNLLLSAFFLFFACTDYDSGFFFCSKIMFILSITLLLLSHFKPKLLGMKTKKESIIYFGISTLLYLCSIVFFHINENKLNYYRQPSTEKATISPQKDTLNTESIYTETAGTHTFNADTDTCNSSRGNRYIGDFKNELDKISTSNTNIQEEYFILKGLYDNKYSELKICIPLNRSIWEGHLKKTLYHPELFFYMYKHKRAIKGTVENVDGQNIGYVEGLCDITDSTLCIKGKIKLESKDYNYTEHKISYSGTITITKQLNVANDL